MAKGRVFAWAATMTAMPSVSITIVNHQACELLRECLLSLAEHPYTTGHMEVVVLDNASGDGSIEMLREEFPEVIVLPQRIRRGFGANQNLAIAQATGHLVLMLNPDAVVSEGTIDTLVAALSADERVVAAACRILNADGTLRQGWPMRYPTPLSIYAKAVGITKLGDRERSADVFDDRWLGGGAMLVRHREFEAIGGFDETFFMYSEDVDVCRRLRDSGHMFAWVTSVSVTHPLPNESTAAVQRRQSEIVRAELHYMRKYYGTIGQLVYRFGAALDSAIRIAALRVPGNSRIVDLHGATVAHIDSLHRARWHALVNPSRGGGLRELASEWNARR